MNATLLLAILIAAPSLAQASDCLIDQTATLPSFESTMGYSLRVARDGTQFPPEEQIAFNQVAAVLPRFYRHMKTLTYFERVPDGYVLEGGAVGEYDYDTWIGGRIYLAQVPFKTAQGRFEGDFHWDIIHEMTHALDKLLGSLSAQAEWRGLSTWDAKGVGTSKNFVTWYASASAAEDFSESVTAFILAPDELLRIAPTKFELISKKLFDGKRYDTQALMTGYQTQLAGLDGPAREARIRQLRATDYYACKLLPKP